MTAKQLNRVVCKALTDAGEMTEHATLLYTTNAELLRQTCQTRGFGERVAGRVTLGDWELRKQHIRDAAHEADAESEVEVEAEDSAESPDVPEDTADDGEDEPADGDEDAATVDLPPIPDTLPPNAVEALRNAGIVTLDALLSHAAEHKGSFTDIPGIGVATGEKIASALAEMAQAEQRDETPSDETPDPAGE